MLQVTQQEARYLAQYAVGCFSHISNIDVRHTVIDLDRFRKEVDRIDKVSNNKIQRLEKERLKNMSLTLIGRSSLPPSQRGATGSLSVRVSNAGQVGFSTSAGKIFDNFTACTIGWDGESRKMIFTPVRTDKLPKGVKAEDTFKVGQSKDGANRYISAAGLFKLDAVKYDYSVGTYSFPATEENGSIAFILPKSMAVKEVKPRKPKAAAAGASAASAPAAEVEELQEA